MRRGILLLASLLALVSCANSRYATGPDTDDIEALPGYRGTIQAVSYKCSEKNLDERRFTVYLPPGYFKDTQKRYPVMYVFHGARGNEVTWIERGDCLITLDSLYARGAVEEFILVLPNANHYFGRRDYKNGRAVNSVRAFWTVNGEVEANFMGDVVAEVDRRYRTIPEKRARAIAGMSTGALQAMYISANNPDSFDYVGLFSAYAYDELAEMRNPQFYEALTCKMRTQFSVPPSFYGLYIGKKDIFYPHMMLFDRSMTRRGYKHELVVTPGGHEWYNWRKYLIMFYQEAFR